MWKLLLHSYSETRHSQRSYLVKKMCARSFECGLMRMVVWQFLSNWFVFWLFHGIVTFNKCMMSRKSNRSQRQHDLPTQGQTLHVTSSIMWSILDEWMPICGHNWFARRQTTRSKHRFTFVRAAKKANPNYFRCVCCGSSYAFSSLRVAPLLSAVHLGMIVYIFFLRQLEYASVARSTHAMWNNIASLEKFNYYRDENTNNCFFLQLPFVLFIIRSNQR